jgi:hypothetical protein
MKPALPQLVLVAAAGIYTHSAGQLEEAGKYLEEKRSAMKGIKIVTELEPTKMYFKAEVRRWGWGGEWRWPG